MTKSNVLEIFSEYLIRNYNSDDTKKTYYSIAKKFIYDKHPETIEKLSEQYLLKYITNIKLNNSISVYNQMVSVLKLIYNKLLEQNKLKNIYCLKQYPKLKILPDYEDVIKKIKLIKNIKHKTLLLTLIVTGARINELRNMKISDINRKTMQIVIEKGKGAHSGFVILTKTLLKSLEEYYKIYKPKHYIFEGINGKYSKTSINKIIKRHIGEKYSAHWMRHLSITCIINKNISLPKAKIFSRHKANSSIEFYYHYDEKLMIELRDCIEDAVA